MMLGYTLSPIAARRLQADLRSHPQPTVLRQPERKTTVSCIAKIEADAGGGQYQAQEWYYQNYSWRVLPGGRQWGVIYSKPYLIHLNGLGGVAKDTMVRAFLTANLNTSLTQPDQWVFDPGGSTYNGPFAVSFRQGYPTQVVVGADRGAVFTQGDQVIIHPDIFTVAYPENVVCTAAGWIYLPLTIEVTTGTSVGAPAFSATNMPGSTAMTLNVPLAQVMWDSGAVSRIRQHQYGNIMTQRVIINYCP